MIKLNIKSIICILCMILGIIILSSGGSSKVGFSVARNKRIVFAPGNLTMDWKGNFMFVDSQYDFGQLYGWGTGNKPRQQSVDDKDYSAFYDWGDYLDGDWHTLTINEWHYLIKKRSGAKSKCGVGNIEGTPGLIILPDYWELPFGVSFVSGFSGFVPEVESDWKHWTRNSYTLKQWKKMEDAGAVFLPANGLRVGDDVRIGGTKGMRNHGYYWSSSPDGSIRAHCFEFWGYGCSDENTPHRKEGQAVRLVRYVN